MCCHSVSCGTASQTQCRLPSGPRSRSPGYALRSPRILHLLPPQRLGVGSLDVQSAIAHGSRAGPPTHGHLRLTLMMLRLAQVSHSSQMRLNPGSRAMNICFGKCGRPTCLPWEGIDPSFSPSCFQNAAAKTRELRALYASIASTLCVASIHTCGGSVSINAPWRGYEQNWVRDRCHFPFPASATSAVSTQSFTSMLSTQSGKE